MNEITTETMIEALRSVDLPAEHVFGGEAPEAVAAEWIAEGLTPEQAAAYLAAGCWGAGAAAQLRDAGITPEQAATETDQGLGGDVRSIGAKVANGDLSIAKAREIVAAAEGEFPCRCAGDHCGGHEYYGTPESERRRDA